MSIVHCDYCNTNIDTDYDVEHFVNEDLDYCIVEEEKDNESENQMNHTKGKIELGKSKDVIFNENGESIMSLTFSLISHPPTEEDIANAERIIRVWNCHDELLEIVLGWREAFNGRVIMKVENEEDKKFLLELNKKAQEAINKATK